MLTLITLFLFFPYDIFPFSFRCSFFEIEGVHIYFFVNRRASEFFSSLKSSGLDIELVVFVVGYEKKGKS